MSQQIKQAKIAVPGSCNVDLTVFTKVVPRGGETVLGSEFQMNIGGKGTNQATAARRAGAAVAMITRIGGDSLGELAQAHVRREGIDTAYVTVTPDTSTGTATIIVDETTAQNRIIVASGANADITPADMQAAKTVIEQADAVLLQSEIDPSAALTAAKLARQAGKRCILNPAPARELPAELIACADCFTPNETEAEFYTGIAIRTESDAFAAGKRLLALGADCAVITLGENGAHPGAKGQAGRYNRRRRLLQRRAGRCACRRARHRNGRAACVCGGILLRYAEGRGRILSGTGGNRPDVCRRLRRLKKKSQKRRRNLIPPPF